MSSAFFRSFLLHLVLVLQSGSDAFVVGPKSSSSTGTLVAARNNRRRFSAITANTGNTALKNSACSVEVIEPKTNCTVVLLGCFHGSQSSAQDVKDALSSPSTIDVVVLELCASRFADLRREQEQQEAASSSSKQSQSSWWRRYALMVQNTAESQGWSTAVAAAALGAVSGMQTAFGSNLQPGLEFTTATDIAKNTNANSNHNKPMDVVLADQSVDVTLQRMGQLPKIGWEMWKEFLTTGSWENTFGREAHALQTALFGSPTTSSVTLLRFLTRSTAAMQEVWRLTAIPLSILVLPHFLNVVAAAAIATTTTDSTILLMDPTLYGSDPTPPFILLEAIPSYFFSLLTLVVGSLSLSLPAARVILRERDDVLVDGIQTACRNLAPRNGRVVAVLGLLHVNGVAERLVLANSNDKNDEDNE